MQRRARAIWYLMIKYMNKQKNHSRRKYICGIKLPISEEGVSVSENKMYMIGHVENKRKQKLTSRVYISDIAHLHTHPNRTFHLLPGRARDSADSFTYILPAHGHQDTKHKEQGTRY